VSKQGGLDQRFYAAGYDLSGDVGSIDRCSGPHPVLEVTGINKSAVETIHGLAGGQIDFTSWFNDATDQEHDALSTLPTADVDVLWMTSATRGTPAAMLRAKQVNYDPTRSPDGGLSFGVSAMASAGIPLEWGVSLTAGTDEHASADESTSVDGGAATSDGLAAQMQLMSLGSGTVTVVVQESSDDGAADAFTSLVSFTAVAAAGAPATERKTVSGAVERYLRMATTGTFTAAAVAVAVRRGLAVDDEAYS